MKQLTRRDVLRAGSAGLAVLGAGGWLLRAGAEPTPGSGELGSYGDYLRQRGESPQGAPANAAPGQWSATEDNILGPYHREGAPFRAKITPPLAAGTVMLISGRVFGFDSRKPLAGAVLDIWQADANGRYDNDDPRNPPAEDAFSNRARLITDESGGYEFETIHPGRYRLDRNQFRPAHIHYMVRHRGYRPLVTQLYFRGDPENDGDPFIKPSLVIDLRRVTAGGGEYERGAFDIVLAPA